MHPPIYTALGDPGAAHLAQHRLPRAFSGLSSQPRQGPCGGNRQRAEPLGRLSLPGSDLRLWRMHTAQQDRGWFVISNPLYFRMSMHICTGERAGQLAHMARRESTCQPHHRRRACRLYLGSRSSRAPAQRQQGREWGRESPPPRTLLYGRLLPDGTGQGYSPSH